MNERDERIGRNELLFREINERLEKLQKPFDVFTEKAEFVCECGKTDCTAQITMSIGDYEKLRADPTHFAVIPGHEVTDVEDVVERREGYHVVRKHAGDPATLAHEQNPRG